MILSALCDWRKRRKIGRLKRELAGVRVGINGMRLNGAGWEARHAALIRLRLLEAEIIYLGGEL